MVKDVSEHAKVGEVVKAKIITFDPIAKRIGLSMKALEEAPVLELTEEVLVEEKKEKKTTKKKTEETSAEVLAE
jgi:general stress protein 13